MYKPSNKPSKIDDWQLLSLHANLDFLSHIEKKPGCFWPYATYIFYSSKSSELQWDLRLEVWYIEDRKVDTKPSPIIPNKP
jgi:hypothetical protein